MTLSEEQAAELVEAVKNLNATMEGMGKAAAEAGAAFTKAVEGLGRTIVEAQTGAATIGVGLARFAVSPSPRPVAAPARSTTSSV